MIRLVLLMMVLLPFWIINNLWESLLMELINILLFNISIKLSKSKDLTLMPLYLMIRDWLLFKDLKVLKYFKDSLKMLISLKFLLCLISDQNSTTNNISSLDQDILVKMDFKSQELDLKLLKSHKTYWKIQLYNGQV